MKKLMTLLLAAGMVFSAANGASAVDIKVSGEWLFGGNFTNNILGGGNGIEPLQKDVDVARGNFTARQRIRLTLEMSVSEALSGLMQFQVGNGTDMPHALTLGSIGTGGTGKAVTARWAYLDWLVPNTDVRVRMGRQPFAAPSYVFNSPVLDASPDGVVVNMPLNEAIDVTAAWIRARALVNVWGQEYKPHSTIDLAYLSGNFAGDGIKVSPYGMLAFVGSEANFGTVNDTDMLGFTPSDENTVAYWVGVGGELTMFDPFKFTFDALYSGNDADGTAERSGWYAALGAEMKTAWATPFLKGWYASGDDADSKGSGRMLSVKRSGTFNATAIYYDGLGMLCPTIDNTTPAGTWGLQLGVKGVSFIEKLNHTLTVTYFQGTNNTNRVTNAALYNQLTYKTPTKYMTTADSAWEINLLNNYKIYDNLSVSTVLAYLITDFDESIRTTKYDNGFRGAIQFAYMF